MDIHFSNIILPVEIIEYIFSFLSLYCYGKFTFVSRSWRSLLPSIITRFDNNLNRVLDKRFTLFEFLLTLTKLTTLHLYIFNEESDIDINRISKLVYISDLAVLSS